MGEEKESLFIATSSMKRWQEIESNNDVLTAVYIGHPRANDEQFAHVEHSLTSPYDMGTGRQRAEALEKYKKWLWKHMQDPTSPEHRAFQRVVELAKEKPIVLICTCYPMACCSQVLKAAMKWWIQEENSES